MGFSAGAQRRTAASAAFGAADDASTRSKSRKVTVETCSASGVYAITSAGHAPTDLVPILATCRLLSPSKILLFPLLSNGWSINEKQGKEKLENIFQFWFDFSRKKTDVDCATTSEFSSYSLILLYMAIKVHLRIVWNF